MVMDWAWRVVFTDGSQFTVRGCMSHDDEDRMFTWVRSEAGDNTLEDVFIPDRNIKYIVAENPERLDWPEGIFITRLPDTNAAPPKPEG